MRSTKGGFLITQIKQVQGRIFDVLLQKAGIEEFNGAQGRILYVLWQEDGLPVVELAKRTGNFGKRLLLSHSLKALISVC